MYFEKGELYHIFNRGNNKDQVFYSRENYLFFLEKIRSYISPFADILAWCLMPNHFHIMVYVNETELTTVERINQFGKIVTDVIPAIEDQESTPTLSGKTRKLNNSIGIMLRSYTNAIQKQEGRTGALFQEDTKAVCITERSELTPSYFDTIFGTLINMELESLYYPQVCFDYIHNNPVVTSLVSKPDDWEFSSYRDYSGIRNGKLINRGKAKELGLSI